MSTSPQTGISSRRRGRPRFWRNCAVILAAALPLIGALGLGGCARPQPEIAPTRLRIAVKPDQPVERLKKDFAPLVAYLAAELKLPCELVTPASYQQMLDEFAAGRIELCQFGGFSYVEAHERAGAVPLVRRDVAQYFATVFIAAATDPRKSLGDFRGASLTFGDRLSTSGHLMARHFLRQQDIEPEKFFRQVGYSSSPIETALLVRDRRVDLGAAAAVFIERMFQNGELRPEDVQIVGETPGYEDLAWAVPPSLPAAWRTRVRDAFLALTPDNPAHAAILKLMGGNGWNGYLPASEGDYAELTALVHRHHAAGLERERQP